VTAGTYPKLTVNSKGLITSGTSLIATDIPNLDWSKITTGKPTTIAGYNITDAYTKTEVDSLMTNSVANKLTKGGDSPTTALAIGNITNQDFNIMTNNITRINIPAAGGANIFG
jgi:phage-related tail fiber protein